MNRYFQYTKIGLISISILFLVNCGGNNALSDSSFHKDSVTISGTTIPLTLGEESTIKGMLQEIHKKFKDNDIDAIKDHIYPLTLTKGVKYKEVKYNGNIEWIIEGLKNPTTNQFIDNGFNEKGLLIIIDNAHYFTPINEFPSFNEFQQGFTSGFNDPNPSKPFINDLQNDGKGIYILPYSSSFVLVYKYKGEFKLVWWKEMLVVAKGLLRSPKKPDLHEGWTNRSLALLNLGRFKEALESADKALQIRPDLPEAWTNRSAALIGLGRFKEALESADKALQIKPNLPGALTNRSGALIGLGRFKEALASADKALQFKPDFYMAWNNRDIALLNLGRFEEALESVDKALQIKPDLSEAWINRSGALMNLGRFKEALESVDKALQIKPDLYLAWNNRSGALINLGRFKEALESTDKALQIQPNLPEAWTSRSVDKALQIKPDFYMAWNNPV